MAASKFLEFYQGEFSKNFMKKILIPLTFGVFLIFLIISYLLYPLPYDITTDAISNLGNPVLNPFPGWFFFSLAFWYLALVFPPFIFYLHKRLLHLSTKGTKVGTLFNVTSVIGMIMLGIFPNLDSTNLLHNISAILAFGGLVAGCISYWTAMIKEAVVKAMKYRNLAIVLILLLITALFSLILIMGLVSILNVFPLQLDFPFWEWTLFIILAFQLLLFILIIPDHFRPHNSKPM
jgi:hypothetical protein